MIKLFFYIQANLVSRKVYMPGGPEQQRAEVLRAMLNNVVRDVLARWRGADGNKDFIFDQPVSIPGYEVKVGRAKMAYVGMKVEEAFKSGQAVVVIDPTFEQMFATGSFKGQNYAVPGLRLGVPMLDVSVSAVSLELEVERALREFVDVLMTNSANGSAGTTRSFVKVLGKK